MHLTILLTDASITLIQEHHLWFMYTISFYISFLAVQSMYRYIEWHCLLLKHLFTDASITKNTKPPKLYPSILK